MDLFAIYSKTPKGIRKRNSMLGSLLSPVQSKVLALIDGKATIKMVLNKLDNVNIDDFERVINTLQQNGYIETTKVDPAEWLPTANFTPMIIEEFSSLDEVAAKEQQSKQKESDQKAEAARARAEAKVKAELDAERKAREAEEAHKKQETERKAKEAAEQKARIEAEQRAKAEAERIAAEQKAKQAAAERKAKEEAELKAKLEAEAKAKAAAEEKARQEAERLAREAEEAKQREEAERKAKAEAEEKARLEAERLEAEKRAKEEAERVAAEQKAKEEAERIAAEQKAKAEAEAQARLEAERIAREAEEARLKAEAEQKAREEAKRQAHEAEEARKKAKEEADAKTKEAAEEKARLEIERITREAKEARKREEAEKKAKQEAERLAAAQKAKEEAELKARQEAEAKAKADAEEQALQEAERLAREAEETRQRKEAEQKAREEAERIAAEQKAKEEAEEKARLEEAMARMNAEERARAEAEEMARREVERMAQELEAAKQKVESDKKAKKEADKKAKEEAKRLAAEQKAHEKAEAKAKAEAEKTRLAEEKAAREAEEAEKKRQAEEKALQAEKLQALIRAEQRQEAAHLRKMDLERAERNALKEEVIVLDAVYDDDDYDEDDEPAAVDSVMQEMVEDDGFVPTGMDEADELPPESPENDEQQRLQALKRAAAAELEQRQKLTLLERNQALLRKLKQRLTRPAKMIKSTLMTASLLVLLLLFVALGMLPYVPLNALVEPAEQLAREQLGTEVRIQKVSAALVPRPYLMLKGVEIGTQGQHIGQVNVWPAISSLNDDQKVMKVLEIHDANITHESFGQALDWLNALGDSPKLKIEAMRVSKVTLSMHDLPIGEFDGDVVLSPAHRVQHLQLHSTDQKLLVQITPRDGNAEITLDADHWVLPLQNSIKFRKLTANGIASPDKLQFSQIKAELYDGELEGQLTLGRSSQWDLTGNLRLKNASASEIAQAFGSPIKLSGQLDGQAALNSHAAEAAKLAANTDMSADFNISHGEIDRLDMSRLVLAKRGQSLAGDSTRFDNLQGMLQISQQQYQLRNLALSSKQLSARGNMTIAADGEISGNFSASLASQSRRYEADATVGGRGSDIKLR